MQEDRIRITGEESRKLKVQPLKLLKGVFYLLKDLSPTNITSLPADAVDMVESISLGDDPGQLAKMLICRSIVDALLNLIAENDGMFLRKEDIETEQLDEELEAVLLQHDYFVENNFFNRPDQSPFFDTIKPVLVEFLCLFDFSDSEIELIFARLKSYFVFSLVKEWRRNTEKYLKIETALKTPFNMALKREGEWLLYSRYIEREIDRPVFSEMFSLRQIYIPLRAFYKKKEKSKENEEIRDKNDRLIVVDLEQEVFRWLKRGDKDDNVRVVRGGPGCGKSSFMKMLAASLLKQNYKVIFIPLHRFELKDDLVDAVKSFLKYDKYITCDPFEEELLVLIFDGLDELSMQGKLLADIANSFIAEVHRKVLNFNNQKIKLRVLISGRDVIIQQNEQDWRRDGQILSILPYFLSVFDRKIYTDNNKLLEIDQRNVWWQKYYDINGKYSDGLPFTLSKKTFEEITAQPLLNYLMALSYERGKVDFTKETNLNVVYNDLLEAVYDRAYDPAKTHVVLKRIESDHFQRMLEEIAVAAWHGNGRTTTVKEIEIHFGDSGLKKILRAFVQDAEKGIVSLLSAFYFRQAGVESSGFQTFEFTHKSFGEYLIAKSIVRKVSLINQMHLDNENDFDQGRDVPDCLKMWVELFASKALDGDIARFVRNEYNLKSENNIEGLRSVQKMLIEFINYVLKYGMPMERISPRLSFGEENRRAVNSEKALLILLGIISQFTKNISRIDWPNRDSFGDWLSRLVGQRKDYCDFIMHHLTYIWMSNSNLYLKDLHGADLSYSNMSYSSLWYANLNHAWLYGANLFKANLKGANLSGAQLVGVDLSGADLKQARLNGAHLRDANMSEANLVDAKLIKVQADGVNMKNTYLMQAKLNGANLCGAQLSGSDLRGADLSGADLTNADLSNVNLYKAKLYKSNLSGVNLSNSNLDNANLQMAIIHGANFDGVKGEFIK